MWNIVTSRNRFVAKISHKLQPNSDLITLVLGETLHNEGQGNYAALDRLMQSFGHSEGNNSSNDVYCGLIPKGEGKTNFINGALAGSYRFRKKDEAALIGIDLRYLEMASRISDVALMFPKLLKAAIASGKEDGATMLDQARASLFRHVGTDYSGDHMDYADHSEFFMTIRASPRWKDAPRAALYFVMAHELDHLFRPNIGRKKVQEIRSRLEKSRKMIGPLWPMLHQEAHQDEILADHAAVEFVGKAASRAGFNLATAMTGSFLSIATVAFDSWFMDKSARTDSHPSAFARAHGLRLVWVDLLVTQNEQNWPAMQKPEPNHLLDVAHAFAFIEWVAGLYGEHRAGMAGATEDVHLTFEVLCQAAGLRIPS